MTWHETNDLILTRHLHANKNKYMTWLEQKPKSTHHSSYKTNKIQGFEKILGQH